MPTLPPPAPISSSVREDDARGYVAPLSVAASITVACDLAAVPKSCVLPYPGYYNLVILTPSPDLVLALGFFAEVDATLGGSKLDPPTVGDPASPVLLTAEAGLNGRGVRLYVTDELRRIAVRIIEGKAGKFGYFVRRF